MMKMFVPAIFLCFVAAAAAEAAEAAVVGRTNEQQVDFCIGFWIIGTHEMLRCLFVLF